MDPNTTEIRKSMLYHLAALAVLSTDDLGDSTKLLVIEELLGARKMAQFSEEREAALSELVPD